MVQEWAAAEFHRAGHPRATLPTWRTDTVLLDIPDTDAVVGTPNVCVRDALAAHTPLLATALERQLGQTVSVLVVVDGCA